MIRTNRCVVLPNDDTSLAPRALLRDIISKEGLLMGDRNGEQAYPFGQDLKIMLLCVKL